MALMELVDRNVVITGAGSGIGRALAHRFAAERPARAGARRHRRRGGRGRGRARSAGIAVDDRRQPRGGHPGAGRAGPRARRSDRSVLLQRRRRRAGGGPEASDEEWQRTWEINVMAHVWAARAVLPEMVERGEGYLISTASAAGLLTQVSALAYSVTKHAAVAAGRVAGDHLRRRRDQGLVPVPAGRAHADARDGARRPGRGGGAAGRRRARARGRRRGGGRRRSARSAS